MKIFIKTPKSKFTIPIILPISIIKLSLKLGKKVASKYLDEEDLKYVNSLDWDALCIAFDELKKYKGLELVNIVSHSGENVKIII
ncbi:MULTISPECIES: hypothetical protein [Caloramator]|jgi:hypothetical protein|uniref:Uncharacterized protein n=1 Tax=Caloramator australicus RC3 TaxID=857293 RepID=I7KAF9_9CLOT|nr:MULTISPECIES: hypothetical protein [Caloramator]MDO6353944.1 hypothetical protein [Caloramator sp. CAR-1]WDU83148.1 hypothetical protein PWK10_17625 [Caloramator sp. Dgby_cultured_2]CCJ34742.1 hypothetical protein CAAU_2659 [Caloramator australicus RC3]